MGGNAIINGSSSDRITLNSETRSWLCSFIQDITLKFNCRLSGSSVHIMNPEISDDILFNIKPTIGDVDIQTDVSDISEELKKLNVPFKESGHQIISIWPTEIGNIQIDFEICDLDEWSRFIFSSPKEDFLLGIKGVAHKYILRAINSIHAQNRKIQLKTKTTERICALFTISPLGVREKYKKIGETYKELSKEEYPPERSIESAFKTLFSDYIPISRNNLKLFESFVGCCELSCLAFDMPTRELITTNFLNLLWGDKAQKLYRDDPSKDFKDKMLMVEHLLMNVSRVKDTDKLIKDYYESY